MPERARATVGTQWGPLGPGRRPGIVTVTTQRSSHVHGASAEKGTLDSDNLTGLKQGSCPTRPPESGIRGVLSHLPVALSGLAGVLMQPAIISSKFQLEVITVRARASEVRTARSRAGESACPTRPVGV